MKFELNSSSYFVPLGKVLSSLWNSEFSKIILFSFELSCSLLSFSIPGIGKLIFSFSFIIIFGFNNLSFSFWISWLSKIILFSSSSFNLFNSCKLFILFIFFETFNSSKLLFTFSSFKIFLIGKLLTTFSLFMIFNSGRLLSSIICKILFFAFLSFKILWIEKL